MNRALFLLVFWGAMNLLGIEVPSYAFAADNVPASAPPVAATPLATPASATAPSATPSTDALADPVAIAASTPAPGRKDLSLDTLGGTELTLPGSIKLGIDQATLVLKSENDLHYTGSRLLQAYGQFLPSVTGTANYDGIGGRTYYTTAVPTFVDGTSRNSGYTITADLNLFNGLADYANLKSSLLRKDASEVTVTYAKQQITLDITQSFLQVILDEKLVNIARKNLQASQERERLLEEQTEVGVKNLSDLFRQQAQTALDESSALSAENRSRTDQIALLRKLRLELTGKYHFVEPPLPETRSADSQKKEEDLVSEALSKRLDLKASSERADAYHWDVHAAFSGYLPKIDFLGEISAVGHYLQSQNVDGVGVVPGGQPDMGNQLGRQVQYTVGLALTWNIFDRLVTAQNVGQARALADDGEIDAQDKRLQVEGEVRQSFGDYKTAVEQLRASKKGLEAAEKAYEVMNGRYTVGAASFLDLITTQTTLVQAQSNRAQALINFQVEDKSLSFALGTLSVE
jgi:outer membrane protein